MLSLLNNNLDTIYSYDNNLNFKQSLIEQEFVDD